MHPDYGDQKGGDPKVEIAHSVGGMISDGRSTVCRLFFCVDLRRVFVKSFDAFCGPKFIETKKPQKPELIFIILFNLFTPVKL